MVITDWRSVRNKLILTHAVYLISIATDIEALIINVSLTVIQVKLDPYSIELALNAAFKIFTTTQFGCNCDRTTLALLSQQVENSPNIDSSVLRSTIDLNQRQPDPYCVWKKIFQIRC